MFFVEYFIYWNICVSTKKSTQSLSFTMIRFIGELIFVNNKSFATIVAG